MQHRSYLLAIGVMTGNSLDGVDVVLTRFDEDGTIQDLKAHSLASPQDLIKNLQALRFAINSSQGEMVTALQRFNSERQPGSFFDDIQTEYVRFVAGAIDELVEIATRDADLAGSYDLKNIDVIGFHGQTCAHFPPSIAKTKDPSLVYTCQLGDGQMLADLTGITVVYDFRSDDLMNGGEAAPLAPLHHQHLAQVLRRRGLFPVAFCNAGNTGNFTVISLTKQTEELCVIGWDVGPFNNYPDKLVQHERGEQCDRDGRYGHRGEVNVRLLNLLFETAVVDNNGQNFLLATPPKSSDPQWYRLIPELNGEAEVDGIILSFEDRLRTAEYFSAYIYAHAFTRIPQNVLFPLHFALCGGGWMNPIARQHFVGLLEGDFRNNQILPQHHGEFKALHTRITNQARPSRYTNKAISVELSESYGFDGTAMEARIFADAAVCRIKGEPFTKPSTTAVACDTVCGIIRFPDANDANATTTLLEWLSKYNSRHLTTDRPDCFDRRYSRAVAGWHARLNLESKSIIPLLSKTS